MGLHFPCDFKMALNLFSRKERYFVMSYHEKSFALL